MSKDKLIKIMLFGAISALVIDYTFKPTLRKTMGLN